MNKINYFALGVLCTVLLGGMFSFASAKWSLFSSNDDNAQLAPSRALVNAHQCNADATCEMKAAKVDGGIFGGTIGTNGGSFYSTDEDSQFLKAARFYSELEIFSELRIKSLNGDWVFVDKPVNLPTQPHMLFLNAPSGKKTIGVSDTGPIRIGINPENLIENFPLATLDVGGDIRATSLKGNGTAYVCVGENGIIFRKMTPCV